MGVHYLNSHFLVPVTGQRLALLAARAPPSARPALPLGLTGCRSVELGVLVQQDFQKRESTPAGAFLFGAPEGTRTPTLSHENLNLACLPIPSQARILH